MYEYLVMTTDETDEELKRLDLEDKGARTLLRIVPVRVELEEAPFVFVGDVWLDVEQDRIIFEASFAALDDCCEGWRDQQKSVVDDLVENNRHLIKPCLIQTVKYLSQIYATDCELCIERDQSMLDWKKREHRQLLDVAGKLKAPGIIRRK